MSEFDKFGIEKFDYHEGSLVLGDHEYTGRDLIEASKHLTPFDLDLRTVDLSAKPWNPNMNIHSFCYHVKRINDIEGDHPIILDNRGYICDGWHRVVKAIVEGKDTIKAVRLIIMPDRL